MFQTPSLRGNALLAAPPDRHRHAAWFQTPSLRGNALLFMKGVMADVLGNAFQTPSLRGNALLKRRVTTSRRPWRRFKPLHCGAMLC